MNTVHKMNAVQVPLKRVSAILCVAGMTWAPGAAYAADTSATSQAQHQQDVATCKSGASGQPLETCLREAAAARQERDRQNLSAESPEQLRQNELARCNRLPESQRATCVAKMTSPTNVQGSVQGGGVLRKKEIQVPATPANPATPASTAPAPAR
ncbi:hypothetical protein ACWGPO_26970 [Achromobacter animicus]